MMSKNIYSGPIFYAEFKNETSFYVTTKFFAGLRDFEHRECFKSLNSVVGNSVNFKNKTWIVIQISFEL